jgi:hypothetical protein
MNSFRQQGASRSPTAQDTLPKMLDLSAEGLTDNVIAVNANTGNQRQKLVMEVLVRHLHAFAREVALTTEEWK